MDKQNVVCPYSVTLFRNKEHFLFIHDITWVNLENIIQFEKSLMQHMHFYNLICMKHSKTAKEIYRATKKIYSSLGMGMGVFLN